MLLGYIDPGSGFIILQGIIAAVVGSAVYFRRLIWHAVSFLSGRGRSPAQSPNPQSPSQEPGGSSPKAPPEVN